MRMRDMLQSKGLAFIAGRPEIHDTFKMEKWEFDWYCEVYESVVQDLGYIPKWLEIVLAEAFIMTPKIMAVINIRNEAKKIEKYQAAHQYTAATIQATGSGSAPQREDFKTRWIVDVNGYFTHDARGKYIPQGDRMERPIINEVNYNLLVKHNGAELIEKIFKK